MHISRPPFDAARARLVLEGMTKGLAAQFRHLDEDPGVLPPIAGDALARASLLVALEPTSAEIVPSLRLCARAAAAAFALGRADRALEVVLEDDRPVRVEGRIPPSLLEARLWGWGAWAALVCDDLAAFATLAAVPVAFLASSPTRGPKPAYATAEALRFAGEDQLLAKKLLESLERLTPTGGEDPEDSDVHTRLDAPPLEVMLSALQGEGARFNSDLARAVELFQSYWSLPGVEWSTQALFSVAVAGAATFGLRRGLAVTFTADALPRVVLEAPPAAGEVLCCPYCRTPIGDGLSVCPNCLEDPRRDALIEMTAGAYREAPRAPCPSCGALKQVRALRCPSCRTRTR